MDPHLSAALTALRHHWLRLRDRLTRDGADAGYTTETVVVIALLVIAAVTVVGIIVNKVVARANSINLGP
ncbi:hypothetical protein [Streptacidiphilus monticola]|uniref:Flp family type IVb pilin n=1 Tax=Streptacidiphilus monticola TaxID=2161674 RepID=A0ABW1G9K3_9ACTN